MSPSQANLRSCYNANQNSSWHLKHGIRHRLQNSSGRENVQKKVKHIEKEHHGGGGRRGRFQKTKQGEDGREQKLGQTCGQDGHADTG